MWFKRKILGVVYRNEELGGEAGGGSSGGGGDTSGGGDSSPTFDTAKAMSEITSDLFDSGTIEKGDGQGKEPGAEKSNPAPTPAPSPATAPPAQPTKTPEELAADKAKADAAATPAPPPGRSDPNAFPKSWKRSPEMEAKWQAADPEIRAEVARREEAMFQGLESYKQDAQVGKAAKSWLAPYMPLLQHHNVDPGKLVPSLLDYHRTLSLGSPAARLQTLRAIAESYGITPDELASEAPYEPPEVKALRLENQRLQSEASRAMEVQKATTTQMLERQIDSFFKDPKNEFASVVAADMLPFVKDGMELQEAYERACWVNPVARQKIQERQAADAQAKREKAERERVELARKATSANVNTSNRRGTETGATGSMDDTMAETLRAIRQRG